MSDQKQLLPSLDTKELDNKLLTESDLDSLNDIIDLYNINFKKHDILRTSKLNDLQDKIAEQMIERVAKRGDEFSNKDLLDYFKIIQDTISKSNTSLDTIKPASIQINQQNINITDNELSKESRSKVVDTVKSLLAKYSQEDFINKDPIIDTEYEEETDDKYASELEDEED